jgi:hypothetical protein
MDTPRRRAQIIGLLLILYMVGSGVVDFALKGAPPFLAPLLGILTEAFWPAIAVVAYPILHPRSPRLATLFMLLGAVILALGILENAGIMAEQNHLLVRMVHGAAMLTLYLALFRMRAIPRLLAGAGMLASLLQIVALSMPFFGRAVAFQLLAPTGICQLVLALWLIAKGFDIGRERASTIA